MSLYAYDDDPRELGPAVSTCGCCGEEWDGPDECPTCTPDGECDRCGSARGYWRESGRRLCEGCDVERLPLALLVMEEAS